MEREAWHREEDVHLAIFTWRIQICPTLHFASWSWASSSTNTISKSNLLFVVEIGYPFRVSSNRSHHIVSEVLPSLSNIHISSRN